jgi:hypothetical protein
MYANRLTESDQEKFHHCIELGRRSVELDPNCCSAFEQLGIAYSIVQAPLAEAKRCVDQTVYLGGLTELATKSHDPAHAQRSEHFEPSADFYFVYWRLFRGDPSRRRQVDWALRRYESAQPKQRSFDAKLRDLQLLERQSALFS